MAWITLRFHPGFAADLTSWTTEIERRGDLIQRVELWPERRTVEHRVRLTNHQVATLEELIQKISFEDMADPSKRNGFVEDVGEISVVVKTPNLTRGFAAPLLFWQWSRERSDQSLLPKLDFEPALRLWEAIHEWSPHRA